MKTSRFDAKHLIKPERKSTRTTLKRIMKSETLVAFVSAIEKGYHHLARLGLKYGLSEG